MAPDNLTPYSMLSSTPVPVCDGRRFVEAGSLRGGDCVFDRDGNPVRVKYARFVRDTDGYRICLRDGSYFTASGGTGLLVRDRLAYYRNGACDVVAVRDLSEADLADDKGRRTFYAQSCAPVGRPYADLPVHPYLMGLVLSLGRPDPSGRVVFGTMDRDMLLVAGALAGYTGVAMSDAHDGYMLFYVDGGHEVYLTYDVLVGLVPEMGAFRVLGAAKAVPTVYMYSDITQRRWLLQGLMDGAGWVDVRHGMTCRFMHGSMVLTRCVAELAHSLGLYCSVEHKFRDGVPFYRADFRVADEDRVTLFHSDMKQRLVRSGRKNMYRHGHRFSSKAVDRVVMISHDDGGIACTELYLDVPASMGRATVLASKAYAPVAANCA